MRTGNLPPLATSIPSPLGQERSHWTSAWESLEGLPHRFQRRRVLLKQQLEGGVLKQHPT